MGARMRSFKFVALLALSVACAKKPPVEAEAPPAAAPPPAEAQKSVQPAVTPPAETLASDTPKTTIAGNTFIAPAGWSIAVRGPATILAPPEGDSEIALVDVQAKDADEAMKLAWSAYGE